MSVTKAEWDILWHTGHRAAQGLYCCDEADPAMKGLVEKGLMECVGRVAWVPEPYYRLTTQGREVLKTQRRPQ